MRLRNGQMGVRQYGVGRHRGGGSAGLSDPYTARRMESPIIARAAGLEAEEFKRRFLGGFGGKDQLNPLACSREYESLLELDISQSHLPVGEQRPRGGDCHFEVSCGR